MLSFVSAEEASMEAFLSVSSASKYDHELRDYADSLVRQGYTRPGWCVIALEAGAPVARAALWAMPDAQVPTDVVMLEAEWHEQDLTAGGELLAYLGALAIDLGAEALSHSVDSPPGSPQYQENEEARARLMKASGYELLRDGLRWRHGRSASRGSSTSGSLRFRSLPEVGEHQFVEAIAATYEGTRDAWINRTLDERGAMGAARADFVDYQGMDHLPEWWELAYTEDGALAGVVMAARTPGAAVIGYVGVVAEQRGRGLAAELVGRGTEQLLAAGAAEIRGDCDRDNVAMAKAFEREGYEQFARRRTYRRSLSG